MSMSHRPSDETLAAFAVGHLDEGLALAVAVHLELNEESRRRVCELQAVQGVLLDGIEPVAHAEVVRGHEDRGVSRALGVDAADGDAEHGRTSEQRGDAGLGGEAEKLIQAVKGVTYVPLGHDDQCCGFGGSFSVRYPEISNAMVSDKTRCIEATTADAVVSTDAGCLMNIAGCLRRRGSNVRVMHLAQVLERTS